MRTFLAYLTLASAMAAEYIVVFHRDLPQAVRSNHLDAVRPVVTRMIQEFESESFHGYVAELTEEMLAKVQASAEVNYVEENGIVHILGDECTDRTLHPAAWGPIRINNRDRIIEGRFHEERNAGRGLRVYVLDTGIETTHHAFEGRAIHGVDFTGEGPSDGNGHGTAVAGAVVADGLGIAEGSTVVSVKVLTRSGSGSFSGIINGLLWAGRDAAQHGNRGLVTLSLGGSYNRAVTDAIETIFRQGVLSFAAAGQSGDPCQTSPAGSPHTVTVSGMNRDDVVPRGGTGCCVDIFAPAFEIVTLWLNNQTRTMSGNSFAVPHTAAVAAVWWQANPTATPQQVKDGIIAASTKGKLTGSQPFSGPCASAPANCRVPGAPCDPATGRTEWNNNRIPYSRCVL